MNGAHDLGGQHGFGPINAEPENQEPVFHADWEKRVFGLVRVLGALGMWTGDMSRHARERQHPVDYLRHSYYENWLAGLEKLIVEKGLITEAELTSGVSAGPADENLRARVLKAKDAAKALAGSPATMPVVDPPRFKIGDRVRARNNHPAGHTREPRYVRGRVGIVCECHGGHIFPDQSAKGIDWLAIFTPSVLRHMNFGARTLILEVQFMSIYGKIIWSPPDEPFSKRSAEPAPESGRPGFQRTLGGSGFCPGCALVRGRLLHLVRMGGGFEPGNPNCPGAGRPGFGEHLLPALAQCSGAHLHTEGTCSGRRLDAAKGRMAPGVPAYAAR